MTFTLSLRLVRSTLIVRRDETLAVPVVEDAARSRPVILSTSLTTNPGLTGRSAPPDVDVGAALDDDGASSTDLRLRDSTRAGTIPPGMALSTGSLAALLLRDLPIGASASRMGAVPPSPFFDMPPERKQSQVGKERRRMGVRYILRFARSILP